MGVTAARTDFLSVLLLKDSGDSEEGHGRDAECRHLTLYPSAYGHT